MQRSSKTLRFSDDWRIFEDYNSKKICGHEDFPYISQQNTERAMCFEIPAWLDGMKFVFCGTREKQKYPTL